jgi:hypothetical protein
LSGDEPACGASQAIGEVAKAAELDRQRGTTLIAR